MRRLVAALLLLATLIPGPLAASRLVAIGDVHGAYPQLVEILRSARLVDADLHWSGETAVLVQTGDLLDRGSESLRVVDLMMRLQEEAAAAGGRVVVLMGNHEAMNLVGDLRYVTPEIYARLADGESTDRERRAWRQWTDLVREIARQRRVAPPAFSSEQRERFLTEHPSGYFAYREALSRQSAVGRWVRSLPAAVRIGDHVFVHGGISPELAPLGVDELNRQVAAELAVLDRSRAGLVDDGWLLPWLDLRETLSVLRAHAATWADRPATPEGRRTRAALDTWEGLAETLVMGSEGPLWYRGYAHWSDEEGEALASQVTRSLGVRGVVVGHTQYGRPGHIGSRFGGRLLLIDTGMLPGHYAGGRASALEIRDYAVAAIYPDGREPLEGAPPLERLQEVGAPEASVSAPEAESPRHRGPAEAPTASESAVWIGPDGRPLPFSSYEEVEEYLTSAEVVSQEIVPVGINRPTKVLLERGGVRAHAVFRDVDEERRRKELRDGVVYFFKDSHRSEVAAYRLARLLGMDNVPPAVPRSLFGTRGSLQLWIEDATMERERLERGTPLPAGVRLDLVDMRVFDNLIGNIDRNQGNILYDPRGKLWLIDHTRSLSRWTRLPAKERLEHCSRKLWEGLLDLERERLEEFMGDALYRGEIEALLDRRDQVVEILRERIAEKGEERVILDRPPRGGVSILPSQPLEAAPPPVP